MATPTNLVELAQQRHEDWSTVKTKAQSALVQAQSDLQTAAQALAKADTSYGELEKKAGDLRTKLAAIATPADGTPLLAELETATINLRAASGAILAAEAKVAYCKSEIVLVQAQVQEADSRVAAAKADWDQAKTDAARRKAAVDALAKVPLSTLEAKAAALLAAQTFGAAKSRIENDFPAVMRDRARARAKLTVDLDALTRQTAENVRKLHGDFIAAKGNSNDKLGPLITALDDAESTLINYVASAKNRYDRVDAGLKRIGGASNPPLTKEQKDQVGDVTLLSDRTDAASKQSSRDAATLVKEQKLAAFELEQLKLLVESGQDALTAGLADASSTVAKAKQALVDAETELQAKETDFTASMAKVLDVWQAALPDSVWRDLGDFDEAASVLEELKLGGASMASALASAETALVQAALASDTQESQLREYLAEVRCRAVSAECRNNLAGRSRFAALRGDL